MNHWWRAYDEAVDNPKLLLLSDRLHRAWFNLMCVSSAYGGTLPDIKIVALKLRMSKAKVNSIIDDLEKAELVDRDEAGIRPHNWNKRQYKTDVTDPTNADRQQRYRDNHRNGNGTVTETVTSAVTETVTVGVTAKLPETEEDTERKKDDAPNGAPKFAFESGRIRLNAKNLTQWRAAFVNLDLEAELLSLSQWAETQGNNWFCAVSGALAKRNREIGLRQKQQSGPKVPLHERPYTDFLT